MNPQLDWHLETFDSDEEFSESPKLHEEEHVAQANDEILSPMDTAILKSQFWLRKFVKPKSLKDIAAKIVWFLPVAIALGDYIGLWWSFNLSLICLVLLQLKPESPYREKSVIAPAKDDKQGSNIDGEELAKTKKLVHDCRKEVSRLLGLVGAPPLEWTVLETKQESANTITEISTVSVVKFLEAHVQFLLTVDQAYHYLQTTASLHMGLGAHSQCVERVERATIAREFRNKRKQSIGASLIRDGVQSTVEPQRGIDRSTLALASVRVHLAESIVAQAESLIQVWEFLDDASCNAIGDVPISNYLDLPEVVDLKWIKLARRHLVSLLSYLVDHLCTIDCLCMLSDELNVRSNLDESMWNVRNAREHLLCTLLLGKKRVVKPVPDSQKGLMQALMTYRDQLNALNGAIWACQFHVEDDYDISSEAFSEKQAWWEQVQQLGNTCRTMESEISRVYFQEDVSAESSDDVGTSPANEIGSVVNGIPSETGDYEHGPGVIAGPVDRNTQEAPTKTKIFKGKGSLDDRPKRQRKTTRNDRRSGEERETAPLPVRDVLSGQMLVKELQNRIESLRPEDEDDDEEETEEERAAREARKPSAPTFLGASGGLLSELKLALPTADQEGEEVLG